MHGVVTLIHCNFFVCCTSSEYSEKLLIYIAMMWLLFTNVVKKPNTSNKNK